MPVNPWWYATRPPAARIQDSPRSRPGSIGAWGTRLACSQSTRSVRRAHVHGERPHPAGTAPCADAGVVRDNLGASGLHGRDVPVDEPRAERVAAGIGEGDLPSPGQHRRGKHGGRTDPAAELRMDGGADDVRRRHREAAVVVAGPGSGMAQDLRAHAAVGDVRRARQGDRDVGQEGGGVEVKGDVLAALHRHPAGQRAPVGDPHEGGVHGDVGGDGGHRGHRTREPAGRKPPMWSRG